MATKKQVKSWDKQIQACMGNVAKERDKIDAMVDDLKMLRDSCDRAYDSLQDARDALSELV